MPDSLKLISGPGCPVCVTPAGYIDALIELSQDRKVIIVSYGDMVRVKGSRGSLADERSRGADVRVVTSADDAFKFAVANPGRQVVFAAVGFETTTPPTADIIRRAKQLNIANLSALIAHKRVLPAVAALLASSETRIDGFLCPGHVSVLIGADAYEPLAQKFKRPFVVANFEPAGILAAIDRIVCQIAESHSEVENLYPAVVSDEPLATAKALVEDVFEPADSEWRALGTISQSGLKLREEFSRFDAAKKFGICVPNVPDPANCMCGQVIQGLVDPRDCTLFGKRCTPLDPVGPCMVSSEGACQAWYKYAK